MDSFSRPSSARPVDEYELFRDFLQQASGILLGDNKQYLVKSRLRKIMLEHNIESLAELVSRLRSSSDRRFRDAVIDAMTTNETLWFRDTHPFKILQEIILPEFATDTAQKPIRIWSAACSTGQEPYSIAMIVDEFKKARTGRLGSVQITATDISQTVLDVARRGEYEMLAIGRGLPQDRLRNYFISNPNGSWRVVPEIQRIIDFRLLNLLDRYAQLGRFDIVFCRNVLIYFSAELKRDIITRMHQVLRPGGYLILGASESMNGLQDKFEMVQCRPGIIYRAI